MAGSKPEAAVGFDGHQKRRKRKLGYSSTYAELKEKSTLNILHIKVYIHHLDTLQLPELQHSCQSD